jgi:DNA-binding NarL/FixJ family response regulator
MTVTPNNPIVEDCQKVCPMNEDDPHTVVARAKANVPLLSNARGKPRVLLADDHTIVAQGFAKLLGQDFDIVGYVVDGHALVESAGKLKPDVVILDLAMPKLNGFDAGRRINQVLPNIKIIVLTVTEDPDIATEVLHSWASGFVLKKSAAEELVKAIRDALRGKKYVSRYMQQKLTTRFVRDPRSHQTKPLTPRQRQVLQLLAEGRTMKEAAHILDVTARTIAFHKYRIMEEFGIKTNSDLVLLAIREHIISAP